jgi:hypothetical protein
MKFCFLLVVFVAISSKYYEKEPPGLNKSIFEYCKKSMGLKVGRGECWDLAKYALNSVNADWEPLFNFGDKVNPKMDVVYPGDILQFKDVKLSNGSSFVKHTAIVYEVVSSGNYIIAHQNFNNEKYLTTYSLNLDFLTSGNIEFYRPRKLQ